MYLREEDVKSTHYKFKYLEQYFIKNENRKNYFLATCYHIENNIDLEFVDYSCPFGGLIGINNSCLDPLLKRFKVFRLHAILHDACGYMKNIRGLEPGYSYIIPCQISSCFIGHISGILFCVYLKLFKRSIFNLLNTSVVVDIECFRFQNKELIIKEIAICGDYVDSVTI